MGLLLCLPGCQELADWRDAQIKTSHEIGEGSKITVPDPPIQIPDKLYGELPLEAEFTILSYNSNGQSKDVTLAALINQELSDASMWLLTKMAKLGYQSSDNASRILEGVTYTPTGSNARYSSIYVKLVYGDAGRSILHLTAKLE